MTNDVRKKYPRAAAVVGGLAVLCLVLGAVQAPAFYVFGAWLGLVAVILAKGPSKSTRVTSPPVLAVGYQPGPEPYFGLSLEAQFRRGE